MLRTERLLLRRPTEADVSAPPAWLSDPAVMDWLGGIDPPHEVVQRRLDDWERFPAGKFLLERLEDGLLVGRVGLSFYDPETWRRSAGGLPELGWALAREHWGQGYATEAAAAVRASFPAERIISLIAAGNLRSARVAERLGARPTTEVTDFPHADEPLTIWLHPR